MTVNDGDVVMMQSTQEHKLPIPTPRFELEVAMMMVDTVQLMVS